MPKNVVVDTKTSAKLRCIFQFLSTHNKHNGTQASHQARTNARRFSSQYLTTTKTTHSLGVVREVKVEE